MSGSRKVWLIVGIVLAAALAGMAAVSFTSTTTQTSAVPVIQVKRGEFAPKIFATGEYKPSRIAMLSAPQIGGGSLQITSLVSTGTRVKKGDLIVEFDPTEQQFKFEQSQSELQQAEQEIIKAKADAAVQGATDKVALLKARFDLRSAQLEIEKNELLSTIDAKKNELALEQAKRALAQLEQDIQSHTASGAATIGLAQEKRHKAQLSMEQAKQNIEKMKVRAPMDGVVAIERNRDAQDMFWEGMSVPDYREGDQAYPGRSIAQVLDTNDMDISAKLNERERNNVKVDQQVEITLDALPDQIFHGVVQTVGAMSSRNAFFDDSQGGRFEVTVRVPDSDPRLLAGFTVQVVIMGDSRKDALYVPRQAIFMNNGKRIVYVKKGSDFQPQEIKIIAETESRAVVDGLNAEAEIALVNPTLPKPSTGASGSQTGAGVEIH
jgi:HlyD family secretion protein